MVNSRVAPTAAPLVTAAAIAARLVVIVLGVSAGGVGGIICYTCDDKGGLNEDKYKHSTKFYIMTYLITVKSRAGQSYFEK